MLRVIRAGLFSTVQDLGRFGYRGLGVPVSGVFDRFSAMVANALLGNPPEAAVVEMTHIGGTFEAEISLAIALAGAPMAAKIDSSEGTSRWLTIPQSATLRPGDRLILGASPGSARTYLAVGGGWLTPVVLGSRSTETALKPGDVLPARSGEVAVHRPLEKLLPSDAYSPFRYLDGPDATQIIRGSLDEHRYLVSTHSNRMGLRMEGPPLALSPDPCRLSSPVSPGAIQVSGGLPLVLGPACGTMGGYPHIGHILSADLDRLGQVTMNSLIRFRRVELAEARQADREYRRHARSWRLRLASFRDA